MLSLGENRLMLLCGELRTVEESNTKIGQKKQGKKSAVVILIHISLGQFTNITYSTRRFKNKYNFRYASPPHSRSFPPPFFNSKDAQYIANCRKMKNAWGKYFILYATCTFFVALRRGIFGWQFRSIPCLGGEPIHPSFTHNKVPHNEMQVPAVT